MQVNTNKQYLISQPIENTDNSGGISHYELYYLCSISHYPIVLQVRKHAACYFLEFEGNLEKCCFDSCFALCLQKVMESSLAVGVFLDFSSKSLTVLQCEGYFFLPTVSSPQRQIKFHPRLWRMGWGQSAGCRAAGHPVWRPGQRTPQILHCLRVLNCPESWKRAIKDQPRADHIPEQMLAASQGRSLRKERHRFHSLLQRLTVAFSSPPASVWSQLRPSSEGDVQTVGDLANGLHRDPPGDADPLGLV